MKSIFTSIDIFSKAVKGGLVSLFGTAYNSPLKVYVILYNKPVQIDLVIQDTSFDYEIPHALKKSLNNILYYLSLTVYDSLSPYV